MRYGCCKYIFKYCGKNVNIERKAFFASGRALCIGDNSGLGINAHVPADTIIGANVMMGPDCYILGANHETKRIDIPMIQQGFCKPKQTMIEDDDLDWRWSCNDSRTCYKKGVYYSSSLCFV